MALKKLPDDRDVTFFDVNTGKISCSYNECYKKFVESSEPKIWTPTNKDYYNDIVKFRSFFHQCTECGRKHLSKSDERKSKESFHDYGFAFTVTPTDDPELVLTDEELKHYGEIVKKRHEERKNRVPYELTFPKPIKRKKNKYGK